MSTTRTLQDVIDGARAYLQDTEVPYRYPTEDLIRHMNDAFNEMRRLRPDIAFPAFTDDPPQYDASELSTPFPFGNQWLLPATYYVVGNIEMRDDQFATGGRAAAMLQFFQQKLVA